MTLEPTIFYDRLQDRLDISWLSDELILVVLPGGYRLGVGWFGELEGSGHFQLWLIGRTGLELYRGNYGRDPKLVRNMVDNLIEFYTDAAPKSDEATARWSA